MNTYEIKPFRAYLIPEHSSRASFHDKAEILICKEGLYLYSYGNLVVEFLYENGEVHLKEGWDFSPTTVSHVKEFLLQRGYDVKWRKDIAKKFEVIG